MSQHPNRIILTYVESVDYSSNMTSSWNPHAKRSRLTPNQVVAHNITIYRELRGWTQKEMCDHLAPLLGRRWSPAVLSAAERSASSQRLREFNADELVALSRLFKIPVGALLQPEEGTAVVVPDKKNGLSRGEMASVIAAVDSVEIRRQAVLTSRRVFGVALEALDLDLPRGDLAVASAESASHLPKIDLMKALAESASPLPKSDPMEPLAESAGA